MPNERLIRPAVVPALMMLVLTEPLKKLASEKKIVLVWLAWFTTGGTSTATALTMRSAPEPGLNVRSTEPFAFKRTNRLRFWLLKVVKSPPTRIRPSPLSPSEVTGPPLPPVPALKVASVEPLEFSRVMPFLVTPLNVTNAPPTRMVPSACTAIVVTVPSAPVPALKLASSVPSAFKRTSRFRLVTPLTCVKSPPRRILPSGCTAMARTAPTVPLPVRLNPPSTEPSGFRRMIPATTPLLKLANWPPTRICPLVCTASAKTVLSGPEPMLKLVSSNPLASSRAR